MCFAYAAAFVLAVFGWLQLLPGVEKEAAVHHALAAHGAVATPTDGNPPHGLLARHAAILAGSVATVVVFGFGDVHGVMASGARRRPGVAAGDDIDDQQLIHVDDMVVILASARWTGFHVDYVVVVAPMASCDDDLKFHVYDDAVCKELTCRVDFATSRASTRSVSGSSPSCARFCHAFGIIPNTTLPGCIYHFSSAKNKGRIPFLPISFHSPF